MLGRVVLADASRNGCIVEKAQHGDAPPDGALAVLATAMQADVLAQILLGKSEDVFVAQHCPLEGVLQVGPVGTGCVVAVVEEYVFSKVGKQWPLWRDAGREFHLAVGVVLLCHEAQDR